MGTSISFLIAVLYHSELLWCALKVERESIGDDCCQNPMEPENRKKLHSLLPLHVKNCGTHPHSDNN